MKTEEYLYKNNHHEIDYPTDQVEELMEAYKEQEIAELKGMLSQEVALTTKQQEEITKLKKALSDCNSIKKGHHVKMKKALDAQGKLLKKIAELKEELKKPCTHCGMQIIRLNTLK